MAVVVVLNITGGEHAGDFCLGVLGDDVAVFVGVDLADEGLGIWDVANGDEHAVERKLGDFVGHVVLKFKAGDVFVGFFRAENFGDRGVEDKLDFFVFLGALEHDFGGAEFLAAVDEVDLAGVLGEVGGLFHGGIAATDDRDDLVLEEEAVAGGAGTNASGPVEVFGVEAEFAGAGTSGDDEGFALEFAGDVVVPGVVFDVELDGAARKFGSGDEAGLEAGAKAFGLLLHGRHEVGAFDALLESREILDVGRSGELTALKVAVKDEGVEIGAGGVNRGGEAGGAASEDDDLFHKGIPGVNLSVKDFVCVVRGGHIHAQIFYANIKTETGYVGTRQARTHLGHASGAESPNRGGYIQHVGGRTGPVDA